MIVKDQLDKLIIEIEGRLNDFETGESDKEETIQSFAELIGRIAVNVAKGELRRVIDTFEYDSELYVGIHKRISNLEEVSNGNIPT